MIHPECLTPMPRYGHYFCPGVIPVPLPDERHHTYAGCECDCHKTAEELAEGKNYQRLLTGQ